MATSYVYSAYATAEFKTAFDVRAIRLDAPVAADLKVGQAVFVSANGSVYSISSTSTYASESARASGEASINAAAAALAKASAKYFIAQSDMTIGQGHVPVELVDYKYKDKVASSATAKMLMVYPINDIDDVRFGAFGVESTVGE